jgi:16S rRNA (uracil1498-N3)-methyltransferase
VSRDWLSVPRIHHPEALQSGQTLELPPEAARHVQVLRLQPGDSLTLFGDPVRGGEYTATVRHMGRQSVTLEVGTHTATEREPACAVHLAVGMPANERMDWLVEKATELGVASVQPLMTARSVLRLKAERAEKKQAHWQAVAAAACEQCGGNRVPVIHPVLALDDWLRQAPWPPDAVRAVLALAPGAQSLRKLAAGTGQPAPRPIWLVNGPEGGLEPAEEARLLQQGFVPVSLGPRVLRAETAALAALAALVLA